MLKRAFGLDRDHDRILFVFDLLRAIAIDVIPEGLFIQIIIWFLNHSIKFCVRVCVSREELDRSLDHKRRKRERERERSEVTQRQRLMGSNFHSITREEGREVAFNNKFIYDPSQRSIKWIAHDWLSILIDDHEGSREDGHSNLFHHFVVLLSQSIKCCDNKFCFYLFRLHCDQIIFSSDRSTRVSDSHKI